jgi:non-specific serine/threonine protein kinase/serine/threonine-protein kinase
VSDRWQRLNELFHAAVSRDERERAAFLAEACAGDEDLLRELSRLVASHLPAKEAFESTVLRGVARGLEVADDPLPVEGRQFGAYRALRELGQGGMGTVFLGERADRQFEKRVAIKLMRRGFASELLLRHFHGERQILASLDHPNIARLLDAGTTADGLPFLVMEYVEGRPIDAHCDAERCTLSQRLELFRRVCAAVSHAHQRLVVHRDLKPSNILVTADGTPKLLDFGIARVLDAEPGVAAATLTAAGLMTPEYASPEQVRGLRLSTLSDVYSLGVVLYELLAGAPPYRLRGRTPQDVLDAVCGAEPRGPSAVAGEEAASRRQTSAERLRRNLRGDLDNIVLMALRKEPERRYRSVDQLSEDLRRHLGALPVSARADTLGYRASRFVRRHRAAVAATALAGLALLSGVAAATWQARRATAHETIARAEQVRAERHSRRVRELAHKLLFEHHDAVRDLAGATPVRERMVRDALEYLDGLAAEAEDDAALQREVASAYERMGEVQGGTLFANLGDTSGAIASVRKALRIRLALSPSAAPGRDATRELASAHDQLGGLLWETGDMDGTVEHVSRALALRHRLFVDQPGDARARKELGNSHDKLGMIMLERGAAQSAVAHHLTTLELARTLPADPSTRRTMSLAHEHLGSALLDLGDLTGALESNRRALAIRAALVEAFPLNADYRRALLVSHYNHGEILARLGRPGEALASYREDLRLAESLSAVDPHNEQYRGDTAYALIRVGDMLVALGDPAGALPHYRRSLAMRSADVSADRENLWKRSSLIESMAKLCRTLARQEDVSAIARCAETAEVLAATAVDPSNAAIRSFFATTYADLGEAYATVAAATAPADARRTHWQAARAMFARSAEVWQDLRARGILARADAEQPDRAARDVARCEAALAHAQR